MGPFRPLSPARLPARRARSDRRSDRRLDGPDCLFSRRVYLGVAWESVYVGRDARGRGVGRALLGAVIPASEAAGLWTLVAGVLVENAPRPRAPRSGGLPGVSVCCIESARMRQGSGATWSCSSDGARSSATHDEPPGPCESRRALVQRRRTGWAPRYRFGRPRQRAPAPRSKPIPMTPGPGTSQPGPPGTSAAGGTETGGDDPADGAAPCVAVAVAAAPGAITAKSPNSVTTAMSVPPKPADEVLSGCHEPPEKRAIVASARGGSETRRTTLLPRPEPSVGSRCRRSR